MTDESSLVFYDAHLFKKHSLFFNRWVKLSIFDVVHVLQVRQGFDIQKIYFYNNHPIQNICVVGLVTAFDDFDRKVMVTGVLLSILL